MLGIKYLNFKWVCYFSLKYIEILINIIKWILDLECTYLNISIIFKKLWWLINEWNIIYVNSIIFRNQRWTLWTYIHSIKYLYLSKSKIS